MKAMVVCWMVAAVMLVTGCASPSRREWRSQPEGAEIRNEFYRASLLPVRKSGRYFEAFQLDIQNNTDGALSVDWNASRYLFNGRPSEGFVFDGIDPKTIKSRAIPADVIPPKGRFRKEIMPTTLVAIAPLRDNLVAAGESGITAGMIPPGDNGILLVVRQGERRLEERLTLTIIAIDGQNKHQ